jgi:predicted nuclease of predicted toxin-antitoxin system
MLKLLLNANLSSQTAHFLREQFNFDVRCILEDNLGQLTDQAIADIAMQEKRVIITSDLDFGQIFHFNSSNQLGVIVLRISDQTIENVNGVLQKFFKSFDNLASLATTLIVIEDNRYRIYQEKTKSE